ncbi:MAG: LOG family protein [Ignavibacteria bacterium]|nr:LOG family protein [Ignavibacteria bacterium]
MPVKRFHPPKAYNNLKFLNSPQARTLRILSEFLEPMNRFRREGIRDTIVIFGSARILPRSIAKKRLRKIELTLSKQKNPSGILKRKLKDARMEFEMSGYYEDAVKLTSILTKWSKKFDREKHFVICSGGGPGIMEAANKGAISAGGKSIGLNISLPLEQYSNPYISKNLSFEFHYFFMRKFWFVYLAKALIMFPGGFGTLDELMEVLTLIQTKKVKKYMPIILYGSKYWKEILNFDAMVKHKTISKNDLRLFRFADTPEEAFQYLKKKLIRLR